MFCFSTFFFCCTKDVVTVTAVRASRFGAPWLLALAQEFQNDKAQSHAGVSPAYVLLFLFPRSLHAKRIPLETGAEKNDRYRWTGHEHPLTDVPGMLIGSFHSFFVCFFLSVPSFSGNDPFRGTWSVVHPGMPRRQRNQRARCSHLNCVGITQRRAIHFCADVLRETERKRKTKKNKKPTKTSTGRCHITLVISWVESKVDLPSKSLILLHAVNPRWA